MPPAWASSRSRSKMSDYVVGENGPETFLPVRKYSATIQVSTELLLDQPRPGVETSMVTYSGYGGFWSSAWPLYLVKAWFRAGRGLGRRRVSCRWPRPTRDQLRDERIAHNEWLRAEEMEDDE